MIKIEPMGVIITSVALAVVAFGGIQTVRLAGAKAEIASLDSRLSARTIELASCAEALDEVNERANRALSEARERARAGEIAADRARAARDAAEAARDTLAGALAASRRDPTCSEQLEIELCPAIPLL